jgi:hypothetical protein
MSLPLCCGLSRRFILSFFSLSGILLLPLLLFLFCIILMSLLVRQRSKKKIIKELKRVRKPYADCFECHPFVEAKTTFKELDNTLF